MTLRLFFHLISIESRRLFSYRVDFWITMFVNLAVQLVILWALWTAVFAESGKELVGEWDLTGILSYGVMVFLTGRVVRGGDLQMAVASEIYDGSLSRYLLYPLNYGVTKYAQQLGNVFPNILQSIVMAACILPFMGSSSSVDLHVTGLLMCIPSLILAHLLFYIMGLLPQLVAFWADNVWSLSVLMRFITMLLGGATIPLSLFPEWSQGALAILPFRYLFEFPTLVILGKVSVNDWLTGLLTCAVWCVVMSLLVIPVWRRGNLRYTGVGI